MGQKIHPIGMRLGINRTWSSRWYAEAKNYPAIVLEDENIRNFVKKKLSAAGISKVDIERRADQVDVNIWTAKPGVIVGRGGQGIDQLRKDLSGLTNKKVQINVQEVLRIEADSQLVAESIATQLEKRIAFRRAMKQAMMRAMKSGAKGIKVMVAGRLGGAEIARTEWMRDGRIPLHTLRADIDYGVATAKTVYGIIGIKVWIFKGEVIPGAEVAPEAAAPRRRERAEKGERGEGRGRRDRSESKESSDA
ncbi:MAG: 30S ribosomal protein S3 [Candidatus Sericytochromatia bacterium]|nr:30S ribosomal protein S3 [Candidatus Sericytochromatia bacterium]